MSAFEFEASVWMWNGGGATSWHFITLPFDVTDEIDEICTESKRGFGSVRVKATIGTTTWTTSVFPSKEQQSFILPVKAPVRKAERLADGVSCRVRVALVDFA
ncbi:MAG: DUF1905 domain-containing protein [Ilumatobacteraceae bacterium]